MKKSISLIIFITFFTSCSFDNSSRIWTGNEQLLKSSRNSNLTLVFKDKTNILEKKELSNNQLLVLDKPQNINNWEQRYLNNFNNVNNITFTNKGNLKKYSKISKYEVNDNILISGNKVFYSDHKGNIGVYSLTENRLIYKFNFYKKKFKNTKKLIQLIIKNDLIVAADNLGYVYCINYKNNKVVWAKNMLIPFRSNLKIYNDILFLSDEKNKIIAIDLKDGNKIDELYTQPAKTVSNFQNNFALDKNNNLLFLSTSGSLYSVSLINNKIINWIQNFNLNDDITFTSSPIIVSDKIIIIATKNQIAAINTNGRRLWDLELSSRITPVVSGNTVVVVTNNNFIILINKETGKILYSNNIISLIRDNFKDKFVKKIRSIKNIFLLDKKLLLVSDNSYFIELSLKNNLNLTSIKKNPFKISSDIIFIDNEMIFVSKKNRVYKIN
tara:strand:+ start:4714 stop:6036 length:1323 start_codon:yes stop_codon:yes gene_type:complete